MPPPRAAYIPNPNSRRKRFELMSWGPRDPKVPYRRQPVLRAPHVVRIPRELLEHHLFVGSMPRTRWGPPRGPRDTIIIWGPMWPVACVSRSFRSEAEELGS